jgi:hypothetical protein
LSRTFPSPNLYMLWKSASLRSRFLSSKRLRRLMSQWIICFWCEYSTASAACLHHRSHRCSGVPGFAIMYSFKSPFTAYSRRRPSSVTPFDLIIRGFVPSISRSWLSIRRTLVSHCLREYFNTVDSSITPIAFATAANDPLNAVWVVPVYFEGINVGHRRCLNEVPEVAADEWLSLLTISSCRYSNSPAHARHPRSRRKGRAEPTRAYFGASPGPTPSQNS